MGGIDLVNIKTFDLNLLRALHALLENCNVSAAARQLNLSQPATSAAVSRLRHALGDVLLVRDGNRMSLSPRAERLLPRVRHLMGEIELALRDDRFDPTTSERAFRIGATDDAIEIIVTPLIERLRIAAPGILMDIIRRCRGCRRRFGRQQDRCRHRRRLVATTRPQSRAASEGSIRRHFRQQETLRSCGLCRRPACSGGTARAQPGRRQRAAQDRHDTKSGDHRAGFCVGGSSRRHYSKHYRLNVFELPLQLPELDIAVASHPRAMSDRAIIWLMDEIRDDARRANVSSVGTR
jgi:DNA-binding transcriptional LysR family regulator